MKTPPNVKDYYVGKKYTKHGSPYRVIRRRITTWKTLVDEVQKEDGWHKVKGFVKVGVFFKSRNDARDYKYELEDKPRD